MEAGVIWFFVGGLKPFVHAIRVVVKRFFRGGVADEGGVVPGEGVRERGELPG